MKVESFPVKAIISLIGIFREKSLIFKLYIEARVKSKKGVYISVSE